MRRIVLGSLVFALCLPSAGASDILLGTEEMPELPDAKDDVQYSALYLGPRDLAYIDLNAAWFSYEPTGDTINLTMRTTSAKDLENAPATSEVRCAVQGDLIRDEQASGTLQFLWIKPSNSTVLDTRVYWIQDTSAATGVGTRISHTFEAILEEPGYFEFVLNRTALMQYGDYVENPSGICFELLKPAVVPPDLGNFGYTWARDDAASQAAYSFVDHRRSRSPEGMVEPREQERPPNQSQPMDATAEGAAPTAGFGLAAVAFTIAAVWVRRGRPTPP